MYKSAKDDALAELNQMMLDFIIDLGSIFNDPEERGDLLTAEVWYKLLHREVIMDRTTKYLLPYRTQIQDRNMDFFTRNCDYVFGGLPKDRVDYYRNVIVNQKRISKQDMNVIWEYLNSMVALSETYNYNGG